VSIFVLTGGLQDVPKVPAAYIVCRQKQRQFCNGFRRNIVMVVTIKPIGRSMNNRSPSCINGSGCRTRLWIERLILEAAE